MKRHTVKPDLMATCDKQSPVNIDHSLAYDYEDNLTLRNILKPKPSF